MDGINWSGLSPSWPMVIMLFGVFSYLIKLGWNDSKMFDMLKDQKREMDDRFNENHKEMAGWINNHYESKVKPIEVDVVRLEKEHSRLQVAISDEYKVLRQQNGEMVKELGEVKVFMATMNERWKNITRRSSDQC